MSAQPVVIIGAGGFGREVHDVVEAINEARGQEVPPLEPMGFLDDGSADAALLSERGLQLLGPVRHLESLSREVQYVIAIGDGQVRQRIDSWATSIGRSAMTLVHPRATVGRHGVILSPGVIVCAGAVITTNVHVGRHTHINLGATVGHDVELGDYVTLNPNSSVSGNTIIEECAVMGTGSSVIQGRRIGERTVVGAGAVVVRDLPAGVTAVGVPAKATPQRSAR